MDKEYPPQSNCVSCKTRVNNIILKLIDTLKLSEYQELILSDFNMLTSESLSIDSKDKNQLISQINNDGTPIQFVVSTGNTDGALRYITEAGNYRHSVERRVDMSLRKIKKLSSNFNLQSSHIQLFEKLISQFLPSASSNINALKSGAIWISLSYHHLKKNGIALYFNGKWGTKISPINRTIQILSDMSCPNCANLLSSLTPAITSFASPLGCAVGISSGHTKIVKIYFRTFNPSRDKLVHLFNKLGLYEDWDFFSVFSQQLISPYCQYPEKSIVYSLEFNIGNDSIKGIKLDVCSHCLNLKDNILKEKWLKILSRQNLDPSSYLSVLNELSNGKSQKAGPVYHAFLGVGIEKNGNKRFNAYLNPFLTENIGVLK